MAFRRGVTLSFPPVPMYDDIHFVPSGLSLLLLLCIIMDHPPTDRPSVAATAANIMARAEGREQQRKRGERGSSIIQVAGSRGMSRGRGGGPYDSIDLPSPLCLSPLFFFFRPRPIPNDGPHHHHAQLTFVSASKGR